MKVIHVTIHGILDYVMGAVLIAAPWLFGFARGGAETWVPVILGALTLVYSLFTDYELGVFKVLPMHVHLLLDVVSAAVLFLSPWLFGFGYYVKAPHVLIALLQFERHIRCA